MLCTPAVFDVRAFRGKAVAAVFVFLLIDGMLSMRECGVCLSWGLLHGRSAGVLLRPSLLSSLPNPQTRSNIGDAVSPAK